MLGDFGLTSEVADDWNHSRWTAKRRGTDGYSAPEIYEHWYNWAVDIWSLGCILFELAAYLPPFAGQHDVSLFRNSSSDDPLGFHLFEDGPYISPFVLNMLQIDPPSRPSATQLLQDFSDMLDQAASMRSVLSLAI